MFSARKVSTMTQVEPAPLRSMTAGIDQPLIAVFERQNGHEVVRYFADEAEADAALSDDTVRDALSLAGAWSDLDWDEMSAALDRIRHESKPTPPIDDLDAYLNIRPRCDTPP
jgi:hypothetical protein